MIIKEKYQESDEEIVSMIQESPYLQYFIGLMEYMNKAPFDAATMKWCQKRLSPELIAERLSRDCLFSFTCVLYYSCSYATEYAGLLSGLP